MNSPTVLKHVTKKLPVALTDSELIEKARDLGEVIEDIASETAGQADQKAQMKARLTELHAREQQLASVVRRREETRDVACELLTDDGINAQLIRLDTNVLVVARPLSEEERQMTLPVEPER